MGDGSATLIKPEIMELGILFFSYLCTKVDDDYRLTVNNMDSALKKCVDKGYASKRVKELLHFTDARTGICCLELPDLVASAYRTGIIAAIGDGYEFCISQKAARALIQQSESDEPCLDTLVSKVIEFVASQE